MTRGLPTLALLLLLAPLLGGCFSSKLVKDIRRSDESRSWEAPALDWTPTDLPVELPGHRICEEQPTYLLDAASTPLYLDLSSGARLTDQRPPDCDSVSNTQHLRLILSEARLPFHPVDSADLRTALLVLDIRDPGRGETRRVWHTGLGSRIVFASGSAMRDERLSIDLERDPVVVRPPLGSGQKGYGWLALTIPLDVATSPVQLVALTVGGATMLVAGAMLGGHPW